MSHPDLVIAAKLAPEDPLVQLGRACLNALAESSEDAPLFIRCEEDFMDYIAWKAQQLGLAPVERLMPPRHSSWS